MKPFIAVVGILLASLHTIASARLKACNHTREPVSLAVHWLKSDKWTSDGWWSIQPGQCITPSDQPDKLTNRYYYYYAVRKDGTVWGAMRTN